MNKKIKLPESKIIEVDVTNIANSHSVTYGSDLEKWETFIADLKKQGYISLEVETESSYYDQVIIVYKAQRRETAEETKIRKQQDRASRKQRDEWERKNYETLKKKFEKNDKITN